MTDEMSNPPAGVWVQADPSVTGGLTLADLRWLVSHSAHLDAGCLVVAYTTHPPAEIRPVRLEVTTERAECDGSGVCRARVHVHGCYADSGDYGMCDSPAEHMVSARTVAPQVSAQCPECGDPRWAATHLIDGCPRYKR